MFGFQRINKLYEYRHGLPPFIYINIEGEESYPT